MLFQEMLSCVSDLYIWKYDNHMNLLSSNCPEEDVLHMILSVENFPRYILEHAAKNHMPLIFSNSLDMNWAAFYEMEKDELIYIYLLGPVFTEVSAVPKKESALRRLSLSPQLKHRFMNLIETFPLMGLSQYLQFAIMMHYCVTKEKITTSDFQYLEPPVQNTDYSKVSKISDNDIIDRRSNHLFEQRLMRMVEEGNIEYLAEQSRVSYTGMVGRMSNQDSLRQMKNMVNTSVVLCTRAAIRGGLAPEIAYILSDHYIQDIEACQNVTEVVQVNQAMKRDFIQRVHNHKMENSISSFAKMCCDYIDLHIEDEFSISDLAEYTGYTEHYIGRKFKAEMKISLKQYITQKKLAYAKLLLSDTTMSISDISEQLHFCSTSYFTKLFHDFTSMTPAEFRE